MSTNVRVPAHEHDINLFPVPAKYTVCFFNALDLSPPANMYMFVCITALTFLEFALVQALPGETGRLPAMGWNSWNEYNCNINEDIFLTVGNLLVSLGLKDLGYEYVNIDDCWSNKTHQRDNSTGRIQPDYNKFPQGIKHTADEIHNLGLKLGIYSDAGTLTCGGYAGSIDNEVVDATTFAEWGIDCSS